MTRNYQLTVLHRKPPYAAEAVFPANFVGFDGHFPGRPILPGFLHVQLALDLLEELGLPCKLREVRSAKFLRPVAPGETLVIALMADQDSWIVRITFTGQVCSELIVVTVGT